MQSKSRASDLKGIITSYACNPGVADMFCCKRSSSKVNNMLPFQYRLYLLDDIQLSVNERQFSEAKKKLKEVKTEEV